MTEVCIAGRGLAALTCALLVARQGRAVRIYGAEPTGARPMVLPQATVELLVDVWGADAGLLAARGVAPPFTLPDEPAGSGSALDRRAAAARQARQVVAERGGAPERELVLRQEAAQEELFARMRSAATDPQPGP